MKTIVYFSTAVLALFSAAAYGNQETKSLEEVQPVKKTVVQQESEENGKTLGDCCGKDCGKGGKKALAVSEDEKKSDVAGCKKKKGDEVRILPVVEDNVTACGKCNDVKKEEKKETIAACDTEKKHSDKKIDAVS